jgi:hypothetical protein
MIVNKRFSWVVRDVHAEEGGSATSGSIHLNIMEKK